MLAIFDVEGVLVDGEFMPALARLMGREREVTEITLAGIRGQIRWEEGLLRRVELLRGASYEDCIRVANGLPLMKGARELFRFLKDMKFRTMAVSGGPSILVNRVKAELGIDHAISNELLFSNGRLSGVEMRVTSNKAEALGRLIDELGLKGKRVSVVDGANDLKLFEIADLRIAFNAQPVVREKADVVVEGKDLSELISVIRDRL